MCSSCDVTKHECSAAVTSQNNECSAAVTSI